MPTRSVVVVTASFLTVSSLSLIHDKAVLSPRYSPPVPKRPAACARERRSSKMAAMRWLDWYGDSTLFVVDVALACCALEVDVAARMRLPAEPERGSPTVVIVSGTVTDRLAPAVVAIIDAATERTGREPTVVSFGACASAGGPYWDSYAVTKGIDQHVRVDVWVPGCPPTPAALAAVLDQIAGRRSG